MKIVLMLVGCPALPARGEEPLAKLVEIKSWQSWGSKLFSQLLPRKRIALVTVG